MSIVKKMDGVVHFNENTISVTDPCYTPDVWCRLNDVRIRPGTYRCFSFKQSNEHRVARIQIIHESVLLKDTIGRKNWKEIGCIGVDAGLAGFFSNYTCFVNDEDPNDMPWLEFCNQMDEAEDFGSSEEESCFKIICPRRSVFFVKSEYGNGYFSRSGYGDGEYPVYAIQDGDEYIALEISFF